MIKDRVIRARVPTPLYNYFEDTKKLTGISISEQARNIFKLHFEMLYVYNKDKVKKIIIEIEENNSKTKK